ncbi:MAG: PQQ-binding-like beta-propeller repeat protein [Candidatus Hydrogenedentota bacterium]
MKTLSTILVTCILVSISAFADHKVLVQGNNKLAQVNGKGKITWEMRFGGIHDIHKLKNGNILTVKGFRTVVEIDAKSGDVVWSYDASTMNGNEGQRMEIHAIQPLKNGDVMIAESGLGRIIEINRDGKLLKEVKMELDNPDAHRDTRLARKIANGNYLACHEGDGKVREYSGEDGSVVWEYEIPMFGKKTAGGHGPEGFGNSVFSALRLENGNTLIGTGNGHSVLEVTPAKEIVWELHQNDLPNITFAWVTTLEVLKNGNLVIGNCHAGPGQPLLVEIDRETKEVVWTFDHFDTFGNSVSNSLLVDQVGKSLR